MNNRRDILKLFGIGAVAVPLIGGVPEMDASVKLIEVPRIEPVELKPVQSLGASMYNGEILEMTVTFRNHAGEGCVMKCQTFLTQVTVEQVDISGFNSTHRMFTPSRMERRWKMEGSIVVASVRL